MTVSISDLGLALLVLDQERERVNTEINCLQEKRVSLRNQQGVLENRLTALDETIERLKGLN